MIIRQQQFQAFDRVEGEEFRAYMLEDLSQFTPFHAQVLGEEGLSKMIRFGIERAAKYEFTSRGPVQFYIELLFLLGVDFDTDPQFPWASQVLRDTSMEQEQRADRLYDEVMAYVEVTGGPDREYARRALRKTRSAAFKDAPAAGPKFIGSLLERMRESYPEKFDYVKEPALRALIQRAVAEAREYAVTSSAGIALIAGMMYALGHGVIKDPKYAFIHPTLTNAAIRDPNTRAERVHSKMMTYLDHTLEHLEIQ